jgi:cation:H+ antiporter
LVKACELIGEEEYSFLGIHNLKGLNLPISIIAVIIAAAATSVPDTILSVKDAKKGNYNDAISNALGSNIFDICFALGLPILIFTSFYGPIVMDPVTFTFSLKILIILFLLTLLTFIIFIYGESIGISKAIFLLLMYVVFIVYIISTLT